MALEGVKDCSHNNIHWMIPSIRSFISVTNLASKKSSVPLNFGAFNCIKNPSISNITALT